MGTSVTLFDLVALRPSITYIDTPARKNRGITELVQVDGTPKLVASPKGVAVVAKRGGNVNLVKAEG